MSKGKTKKLTLDQKRKLFKGNVFLKDDDVSRLKSVGLYEKTKLRRARYWCFKLRNAAAENRKPKVDVPPDWKEFVENLHGFAGWENFAKNWDITTVPGKGEEYEYMIVLRLISVWKAWDQVMERVSIPIDTPPAQINERIQALTDEYARKELKKNK